eukprot:TRINITY_DN1433_c0_g1_i3.p1 TRINITY_DN1433_c0_g1~~TRINITY_DN1433_c0_g1_i3.p1  ORF type:complete len:308 (-),score=52.98 TRINITY_DN1433_c0_g1_i3:61-984(-)
MYGLAARGGGRIERLVMQHQLYTVMANRTAVDRELNSMCLTNELRKFKLMVGKEVCHALLQTDAYMRMAAAVLAQRTLPPPGPHRARRPYHTGSPLQAVDAGPPEPPPPSPLQLFAALMDRHRGMHVMQHEVQQVWTQCSGTTVAAPPSNAGGGSSAEKSQRKKKTTPATRGGPLPLPKARRGKDGSVVVGSFKQSEKWPQALDSAVRVLCDAHLLLPRRDIREGGAYWFTTPLSRSVMANLTKGQTEVLKAVSRKRYGEMRKSELLKLKLKASPLPMKFHLRDLEGLGQMTRLETPSGDIYKIPRS